MRTQVVILAAGLGTRLGSPVPKPLTPLADGRSIMRQQLENVRSVVPDAQVLAVVGFKHEMIMEAHPDLLFVYNEVFDRTNTSKSLLRALRATNDGGVLWLNGDVVFDRRVMERIAPLVAADRTFVVVNTAETGEEEVKYTVDGTGAIAELSKTVVGAAGEAVGINHVSSRDKAALVARLDEVDEQDYFERGIELLIERDGVRVEPVDVSDLYAIEVDDADDLATANRVRSDRARDGL